MQKFGSHLQTHKHLPKLSVLVLMTETQSIVVRITLIMLLPMECQQSMCIRVFITS